MFTPHNMSQVTCRMSNVTCHVSRFTCNMSRVTCHMSFFFLIFSSSSFLQIGEVYRGRVCYQRGLPRLVFLQCNYFFLQCNSFSFRVTIFPSVCYCFILLNFSNFTVSGILQSQTTGPSCTTYFYIN